MLNRDARTGDVNTIAFWESIYERREDQWELRRPSPPLVEFLERTPLPPGRVAVPGCGRGYDAKYLAQLGHSVVGFDFAPAAVREARALAAADGVPVEYVERDLFTLPRDYANAFDGVWEYVCFCAIDPARRREYARVIAEIVRPGGWFLACFFPVRAGVAGPPYPVRREEIAGLFVPPFRIERAWAPTRTVRARVGLEWMVLARKTWGPS